MWITPVSSPVTLFTFRESASLCWVKFNKVKLDFTKPVKDAVIKEKTHKFKIFGDT